VIRKNPFGRRRGRMNLEQHLQQYNEQDIYPMHMTGHKRNRTIISLTNPYEMDYTEVEYLDDLHEARANPRQGGILLNLWQGHPGCMAAGGVSIQ